MPSSDAKFLGIAPRVKLNNTFAPEKKVTKAWVQRRESPWVGPLTVRTSRHDAPGLFAAHPATWSAMRNHRRPTSPYCRVCATRCIMTVKNHESTFADDEARTVIRRNLKIPA